MSENCFGTIGSLSCLCKSIEKEKSLPLLPETTKKFGFIWISLKALKDNYFD
jgi:hypothetical protein